MEVTVDSCTAVLEMRGSLLRLALRLQLLGWKRLLILCINILVIRTLCHLLKWSDQILYSCMRSCQTRWEQGSLFVSVDCVSQTWGQHINRALSTSACCFALLLSLAIVAFVLFVLVEGTLRSVCFSTCANKPSIYLVSRSSDPLLRFAAISWCRECATCCSTALIRVGTTFSASIVDDIL